VQITTIVKFVDGSEWRHLLETKGRIIEVTSTLAIRVFSFYGDDSTSKFALERLVQFAASLVILRSHSVLHLSQPIRPEYPELRIFALNLRTRMLEVTGIPLSSRLMLSPFKSRRQSESVPERQSGCVEVGGSDAGPIK